jgi:hypothetical protein
MITGNTNPHHTSPRAALRPRRKNDPSQARVSHWVFVPRRARNATIASADMKKTAPSGERMVVAAHSWMCPRIRSFVEMPIA